jgi:hypothetical protein
MQKKKNKQLLVSLGVLSISTLLVYFFLYGNDSTVVDKNLFKVENLTAIDRVELTSGKEKVELKFNGARWRVNDQLADPSMIDVLFATLQQVEPKRPVASSIADSIQKQLGENGVMVRLFEGDHLQKEFVAGGNSSKTQAYFKDTETGQLVVMMIPGYRVYASGIFELNENGWKDKYVFNFNWRNFKQLKVSFPQNEANGFEVEMGMQNVEIKGMEADTAKLNDFLDAISLITVEQFVSKEDVPKYDSLVLSGPLMNIQVSDISGKEYQLALYPSQQKNETLAIVHGNQPAYISNQKVKNLIRTRAWFNGK